MSHVSLVGLPGSSAKAICQKPMPTMKGPKKMVLTAFRPARRRPESRADAQQRVHLKMARAMVLRKSS